MSSNHPQPGPDHAIGGATAAPPVPPAGPHVLAEGSGASVARRVLRCRTAAAGHFRQMNHIRDLPAHAIEQQTGEASGEGGAPTPPEALLAALGSCVAVGIQANAVARAVPIKSLALELEADFDPTAAWGVAGVDPGGIGFNAVRITAHIEADAPREVLEVLLSHVVLWSPVSNTLHNPVHIDAVLA